MGKNDGKVLISVKSMMGKYVVSQCNKVKICKKFSFSGGFTKKTMNALCIAQFVCVCVSGVCAPLVFARIEIANPPLSTKL